LEIFDVSNKRCSEKLENIGKTSQTSSKFRRLRFRDEKEEGDLGMSALR
jgi:hypothetical protein